MRGAIVLRPEPGATATLEQARALGLDAIAVPLFEIEPIEWTAPQPGDFDGLLLTSANVLRHGGTQLQELRGLKVYAVGEATAGAARQAGFDVATTGDAGVQQLLGSIDAGVKLLHLSGEDRHESDSHPNITVVTVYRARPVERPDLSSARGRVALIHSPRAGRRFAELLEDRGSIAVAAISNAAAEAVGTGWEIVQSVERPCDEALLALTARLCNTSLPQ
jgi:uroporphyrinogen-III synthase